MFQLKPPFSKGNSIALKVHTQHIQHATQLKPVRPVPKSALTLEQRVKAKVLLAALNQCPMMP